ncbi:DUF819 family protein [Frigoriflavimonas asaccharolytica]|uniref:Putative membrane protein n=1 Tax=Frigoriflavimonas asaccharolytica TaxID=2735899 RepID=A0A8J8K886_9FLAO|nr:DUF819 family protein [Frigoriflavimonas asaccharolytica]NRS92341.1 putative membrane protein [Frigoriflavimonas asaccharolytica]
MEEKTIIQPIFTENIIVFGILAVCLALIFYTSSLKSWKKFYSIFPALLLCYMVPAVLNTTKIISSETEEYEQLYHVASRYFLPASLLLLCLGIDLKGLFNLGWKPIVMFLSGTLGVVIGGPIALLLFSQISPETVAGEGSQSIWRGLSTLAGSWIGGGANQTAMLEIYGYDKTLYGGMILVDIVVANIWMAILLFLIGKNEKINKWLKADNSAIADLVSRVENYSLSVQKQPTLKDYMVMMGITFGGLALSYFLATWVSEALSSHPTFSDPKSFFNSFTSSFLWLILFSTIIGVLLSLTKLRKLEGSGASKIGSLFIYILVAVIGLRMDIMQIFDNPLLIVLGMVWMLVHVIILFATAKIIKAPFFFIAVGSKANIGGAASAPVVAGAFNPSLAPVGALLAILGYVVGTFAALVSAMMMEWVTINFILN